MGAFLFFEVVVSSPPFLSLVFFVTRHVGDIKRKSFLPLFLISLESSLAAVVVKTCVIPLGRFRPSLPHTSMTKGKERGVGSFDVGFATPGRRRVEVFSVWGERKKRQ